MRDSVFLSEKRLFAKIAMLLTIPCAILPIMMATAMLLSIPYAPMLFPYDYWLAGIIYGFYSAGLIISRKHHKKLLPLGIFAIHLLLVYSFVFLQQEEWLGYAVITSIMASSLSNQYLRIGSFTCNEGCEL